MNRRSSLRPIIFALALALVVSAIGGCASGPPPTPTELGESALAEGDWRAALNHFTVAVKADSANGRAWLGRGQAFLTGRDPEAALQSLVQLSKVDVGRFRGAGRSTYGDALAGAIRLRLERQQAEAALVAARALSQLEPNRGGVRRLLGEALLAEGDRQRLRGDPRAAYALLSEATQVDPSQLAAWIASAELLIEAKDGKGAVRLLEAARKHHPTAREIRTLSIQALGSR